MSGASANPVYQSIQLALNNVDVKIAELRAELNSHQQKAKELSNLLNTTPELEAQYAQLSRDYDINKKQYAALLAGYDKARLGEQAGNAGAVRFELVQPPTVSYAPVWPQRTKFLAVVLLIALGAGGALAYALNQLRPVVGSPTALRQLAGIPVVAVVGCAFPTRAAITARSERRRFSIAIACLIVGFVIVVVLSHFGVRLGGHAGGERMSIIENALEKVRRSVGTPRRCRRERAPGGGWSRRRRFPPSGASRSTSTCCGPRASCPKRVSSGGSPTITGRSSGR